MCICRNTCKHLICGIHMKLIVTIQTFVNIQSCCWILLTQDIIWPMFIFTRYLLNVANSTIYPCVDKCTYSQSILPLAYIYMSLPVASGLENLTASYAAWWYLAYVPHMLPGHIWCICIMCCLLISVSASSASYPAYQQLYQPGDGLFICLMMLTWCHKGFESEKVKSMMPAIKS